MSMSPLLPLHIVTAGMGLVSGALSLSFRKGSRAHRAAGTVFFASMLCMSASGAYLAWFKPAMSSVIAGSLSFYLVATAWLAARRGDGRSGLPERLALLLGLATGLAGVAFGLQAAHAPDHLKDGFPAGIYYFFAGVALFASGLDAQLLNSGGLAGTRRIARHLWRMCSALAIATTSFFLGQQQVLPEEWRGSILLFFPTVLVLALMIWWLFRTPSGGAPVGRSKRARRMGAAPRRDVASPSLAV